MTEHSETCVMCGKVCTILLIPEDLQRWEGEGGSIQQELPYLEQQDRELLISGICSDCLNKNVGEK